MISENQIGTIDFLFYLMWCLIYWVGLEPTRPSPMGGADYRPNRDVGKKQKDLKLGKWIVGIGPKQKSRVVCLFVYFVLIPKTWSLSPKTPFKISLTYPTQLGYTPFSLSDLGIFGVLGLGLLWKVQGQRCSRTPRWYLSCLLFHPTTSLPSRFRRFGFVSLSFALCFASIQLGFCWFLLGFWNWSWGF